MEPELVTTHDHGGPVRASQHTQLILGMVMTILVAATAVGAVLLWPHNVPAKQPWLDPGASLVIGSVTQIVPDDGQTGHLVLRLDDGSSAEVPGDPSAPLSDVQLGQRVLAMTLPGQPGAYFIDYERGAPMLALAVIFVGLVIAVARWKGVAALVGLATALAIVWTFTLPALSIARNPLAVALVTAALVMFVVVYLAHGISVKTTTALIGTFLGIAAVAGLAWWAIPAASLTPLQDEVMGQLPSQFPGSMPAGFCCAAWCWPESAC